MAVRVEDGGLSWIDGRVCNEGGELGKDLVQPDHIFGCWCQSDIFRFTCGDGNDWLLPRCPHDSALTHEQHESGHRFPPGLVGICSIVIALRIDIRATDYKPLVACALQIAEDSESGL